MRDSQRAVPALVEFRHKLRKGRDLGVLWSMASGYSGNASGLLAPMEFAIIWGLLTQFNLKVKLHVVDPLFVGIQFRTQVWISERAAEAFVDLSKKEAGKFAKKLDHYARGGFRSFIRPEGPIRSEGQGVFRIGLKESLFRLLGFFEEADSDTFIIIDALLKRGQRLSSPDRDRIAGVAKIRNEKRWRRRLT